MDTLSRDALLNFLGFGNRKADAVFIGMEEGFTEGVPLLEQLQIRSSFTPIMDLNASSHAHPDRYLSGAAPPIQPTWNTIIRVLLALEGNTAPTNDEVRFYQRDRLGRSSENGALLELFPLPAAGLSIWPYAELFPEFPNREVYRAKLLPERIRLLREHLAYGPRVVVCYGKAYWDYFEALFPEAMWSAKGRLKTSVVGKSLVILTPHFTSREFNGARESLIGLVAGNSGGSLPQSA